MKKALIILAILTTAVSAFGQASKVQTAIAALYDGELLKAREAIDVAIFNEKTKDDAKTWYYRGQIYYNISLDTLGKYAMVQGSLDTALSSFRTALKFAEPKSPYKLDIGEYLRLTHNSYFNRAAIAFNAGDMDEAFQYFSMAHEANLSEMEANPLAVLDTAIIFDIAFTAESSNKTDKAIELYEQLVKWKYDESKVYSNLSDIYISQGRYDDAKVVIDAGRANFPKDIEIMRSELNYYINQKMVGALIPKLEEAIKLDSNNIALYANLGFSHVELMTSDSLNADYHFDEAEKAYEHALRLNENNFEMNQSLGALYFNQAIDLNKRLNAMPLDKEAEYNMLLTERNNLYTKALPYFEKAHAVNLKDIPTMQALKEIYVRLGFDQKAEEIKKQLEG